jgi:predicted MFS family arabinose efflux permease
MRSRLLNLFTSQEWPIVLSIFLTVALISGPAIGTPGVFLSPLARTFTLRRAQAGAIYSVFFIGYASAPLVGWALDRIGARIVIVTGACLAALGLLANSIAPSFHIILAGYLILGVGWTASAVVPASFVVANSFGSRRGTAMGIVMSGLSVGPMITVMAANFLINAIGWRLTYVIMAVPIATVVIPATVQFVLINPHSLTGSSTDQPGNLLPGLEVRSALRSRSFWLIAMAQLGFALATTGLTIHLVPYLTGIGYRPTVAALALSLGLGLSSVGNVSFGWLTDRVRGSTGLAVNLGLIALSFVFITLARSPLALWCFILIYGTVHQGPTVLVPMTLAESLGLRRFGSLAGLVALMSTVGSVVGPILAGKLFDLTGSYVVALEVFIGALTASAFAAFICRPVAPNGPYIDAEPSRTQAVRGYD